MDKNGKWIKLELIGMELKKDKRSYRLDMMRIHRNCIKHIVPTIKLQVDKFWNLYEGFKINKETREFIITVVYNH